jgi:hypothetical protein
MVHPTRYADPLVLEAALRAARAGQSFAYATGDKLDPAHPTDKLVKRMAAAGEVELHNGGRDPTGQLRRIAVRASADSGVASGLAGPEPIMPDGCAQLLAVLRETASLRAPCPSNRDLAVRARLQDRHAAAYRLHTLKDLGLIKVTNPTRLTRVVTITASGQSTAKGEL